MWQHKSVVPVDASSHYQFILATMRLHGKAAYCVIGLVDDNEPLNKAVAKMLKCPMIRCDSHRLNLAVNMFLIYNETILEKIHSIMINLATLKRSGA